MKYVYIFSCVSAYYLVVSTEILHIITIFKQACLVQWAVTLWEIIKELNMWLNVEAIKTQREGRNPKSL